MLVSAVFMLSVPNMIVGMYTEDQSVASLAKNLLLMAEDQGLGVCCLTGPLIAEKRLKDCFAIPENWRVAAIIAVGHPDEGDLVDR